MEERYGKYGAIKVAHNTGYLFDSKLEGSLYDEMVAAEKRGELRHIRVKPNVHLTEARILMIPDFSAFDVKLGRYVFFEAKGFETDVWRIKRRLWKHYGPGILRVFKGRPGRIKLVEEITPPVLEFSK